MAEAGGPASVQLPNTSYEMRVELPRFGSVQEERTHRRQRLAAAFRIFSRLGLDHGANGHASVRDPQHSDRFFINPPMKHFSQIRASDLLLVNGRGETLEGDREVDPVQFNIHWGVLEARPDIVGVAHVHGVYGRAWATALRPLSPLTQDHCAFYEDHAVMTHYSGVVGDPEEGKQIAFTLGATKAVVLGHHGTLTVGATIDSAAWWLIELERCCQIQVLAESMTIPPHTIPEAVASATARFMGDELTGWVNFQPLFDRVAVEQPELFD